MDISSELWRIEPEGYVTVSDHADGKLVVISGQGREIRFVAPHDMDEETVLLNLQDYIIYFHCEGGMSLSDAVQRSSHADEIMMVMPPAPVH